jgi:hypothetical protein
MCDMQGKRERWMELAAQVADEQDPQELSKQVQELVRLLAEKQDRLNHATPILQCAICDKSISLGHAKTDGDGKAVHEDCLVPRTVAVSPITLTCPKCHAVAGDVCEVLLGQGLEIVHVERINAALALDRAQQRLRT